MLDFDLQIRFWRGVTDAYLHSTQATMAAASAWQGQVLSPKPEPKPAIASGFPFLDFAFWPWGMPLRQSIAPVHPVNPVLAMMPWVEIFWRQSADMMPMTQSPWGSYPQPNPAAMFRPFWDLAATPWAFMQTPLTAMMMSAGLPYAVASPSAKASTSAMDAAEAARQQMENVFSAYRSDGGHAAAQMASLPWSIAASFVGTEANRSWPR